MANNLLWPVARKVVNYWNVGSWHSPVHMLTRSLAKFNIIISSAIIHNGAAREACNAMYRPPGAVARLRIVVTVQSRSNDRQAC
jgi:hypothetical protein